MEQSIRWIRWLILFVVAWLVGVYVFDLVFDLVNSHWRWITAGGMAMASWLVNLYARKRATKAAKGNRAMLLWLTIPPTLFFMIPLSINLYAFWTQPSDENKPSLMMNLLVFGLRYVVPVGLLLIVYWLLGRVRTQLAASASGVEEAQGEPGAA